MLDQLVESKSNAAENARRSEFLLVVLVIAVVALIGAWTYSLLNNEATVDELATSSLMKVAEIPEDAPPPEPPKPDKAPPTDKIVVKDMYASMDQTTEPPKDTIGQSKIQAIPKGADLSQFQKGDPSGTFDPNAVRRSGDGGGGGISSGGGDDEDADRPPPPPKPVPKIISGGVVNGKATNLVKPPYPAAARAVRAAGAVQVQVTIDEGGSVISASAVSGHPLLRAAAVQAARSSRFSPTLLSGQAVKVSGVIIYNFVP